MARIWHIFQDMKQTESLDLIKIEDKYSLSEEEIAARAMEVAIERASINGWKVSSVNKRSDSPIKHGEYLRYEFEVFGEIISSSKDSDPKDQSQSSIPAKVAARPADLDL